MSMKTTVMIGVFLCVATKAFGQPVVQQVVDSDLKESATSLRDAEAGVFSPLLLNAALVTGPALVLGNGGYDTARSGALFDSAAEVRVWGPVSLRADVTYADDTRRMRPSVGARVQLLRQAAHGVDGTLSSFFKTEGFDETEGEIETTFAMGRRFENSYVLGNVAYGQDPEGNERDGELRASWLHLHGRLVWGAEARARSAIGPQHGTHSNVEPRFDAVGGPTAMVGLGSFVLFAELGPSAVKLAGADTHWGVSSLGGVGTIF